MSARRSRIVTVLARVLACTLLVYASATLLDRSPVGSQDNPAYCGNAFQAGSDSDDASFICGMHTYLGRLVGGVSVVLAMLVLAADGWRRSRRRRGHQDVRAAPPVP